MMATFLIKIIQFITLLVFVQSIPQCKDEAGKPVDWYVLYKIPKLSESSNPLIRKGIAYLYITNNTVDNGWQLSKKEISSVNSIPAITLADLYKDNVAEKLLWIMYNDQPPNGKSNAKYGHAKGVVQVDKNHGFWLIHSVPHFPSIPNSGTLKKRRSKSKSRVNAHETSINEKDDDDDDNIRDGVYDYPKSGKQNGQSFLCISVDSSQMDIIGGQLMYNQVIPYRYNLPKALAQLYPSLANASRRAKVKRPPYNRKEVIKSLDGMHFISFAKSDKWQKDLYDDFVAPQLNTDLFAETWLNGRGKLPSDCNSSKVLNVQSIVLNAANVDFKSSHDHSKWAVSAENKSNRNWVCVGDINRADTQFDRGGGTVCMNIQELWSNYRNTVNDIEPCPLKRRFSSKINTNDV